MLKPGDRVWVNIPGTGYVGVAKVTGHAVMADEFITPELHLKGEYNLASDCGEDEAEYFVPVSWLHQVPCPICLRLQSEFFIQHRHVRPRSDDTHLSP